MSRKKNGTRNLEIELEKKAEAAWIDSLANPPPLPSLYEEILQNAMPPESELPRDDRSTMLPPLNAANAERLSSGSALRRGRIDKVTKSPSFGSGGRTAQWLERLDSLDTLLDCYSDDIAAPGTEEDLGSGQLGDEPSQPEQTGRILQRRHSIGAGEGEPAPTTARTLPSLLRGPSARLSPVPEPENEEDEEHLMPQKSEKRLGRRSFRRWTLDSEAQNPVEERAKRRLKEHQRAPAQRGKQLHHLPPGDMRPHHPKSARHISAMKLDRKGQEVLKKVTELQEFPARWTQLDRSVRQHEAERKKKIGREVVQRNKKLAKDRTPEQRLQAIQQQAQQRDERLRRVQSSRASTAAGSDGPKSLPGTAAAPERDSKWSRQVGPPWAQACAGAAGMHRALTALREQIVAAREARQAHASAAIIQGIWRSVHLQRNRAAGAIQSAWKMRMAKKAFHRDICAVVWMQRQFRRNLRLRKQQLLAEKLRAADLLTGFIRAVHEAQQRTAIAAVSALPRAIQRLSEAKLAAELEDLNSRRIALARGGTRSMKSKISPPAHPGKFSRSLSDNSRRQVDGNARLLTDPLRQGSIKSRKGKRTLLKTDKSERGDGSKAMEKKADYEKGSSKGRLGLTAAKDSADAPDPLLLIKGQDRSTCKKTVKKRLQASGPSELLWR